MWVTSGRPTGDGKEDRYRRIARHPAAPLLLAGEIDGTNEHTDENGVGDRSQPGNRQGARNWPSAAWVRRCGERHRWSTTRACSPSV
jgi:hypothetical protein